MPPALPPFPKDNDIFTVDHTVSDDFTSAFGPQPRTPGHISDDLMLSDDDSFRRFNDATSSESDEPKQTDLFQQIERARIVAGGPWWSTRGVVRELKRRDFETFKGLSRTTVDEWIDRSGSVPKWSDKTLERIKRGNQPGHSKGGQRGVLVSF